MAQILFFLASLRPIASLNFVNSITIMLIKPLSYTQLEQTALT
jgi:hypothetical protein